MLLLSFRKGVVDEKSKVVRKQWNENKEVSVYRLSELNSMSFTSQASPTIVGATLKIHKKSNFDRNQLKLSTQHKYMYMHQEM